jgi:hypothetical protein
MMHEVAFDDLLADWDGSLGSRLRWGHGSSVGATRAPLIRLEAAAVQTPAD